MSGLTPSSSTSANNFTDDLAQTNVPDPQSPPQLISGGTCFNVSFVPAKPLSSFEAPAKEQTTPARPTPKPRGLKSAATTQAVDTQAAPLTDTKEQSVSRPPQVRPRTRIPKTATSEPSVSSGTSGINQQISVFINVLEQADTRELYDFLSHSSVITTLGDYYTCVKVEQIQFCQTDLIDLFRQAVEKLNEKQKRNFLYFCENQVNESTELSLFCNHILNKPKQLTTAGDDSGCGREALKPEKKPVASASAASYRQRPLLTAAEISKTIR